jgi:hypothetical protein
MRRKRERSADDVEERDEDNDDNDASASSSSEYSEDESTSSDEGSPPPEETQETQETQEDDRPRKTVNVAFDFASPSESDFQPLKALLNSYAPSLTFPLSTLVDAVISAPSATVIRASDGDEDDNDDEDDNNDNNDNNKEQETTMVGVGALLRNGGSLLRGMFGSPEKSFEKRLFTDANHVIVIERLMNTPPQLGGPLLEAMFMGTDVDEDDEGTYVVVGRAYASGGERAYALPEFGCLAEDGVAAEVVWVDEGAERGVVRFVAVVEGGAGVGAWADGIRAAV